MELVIAESVFAQPVTPEFVEAHLRSGHSCHDIYRVRHLRSCLSMDGLRMICEFEAPDAEAVRALSRRLGVCYERVWTARVLSTASCDAPNV